MNNRSKNSIYSLLLLALMLMVYLYRSNSSTELSQKRIIEGTAMGTTYQIIYFGDKNESLKNSVDSILDVFNKSLSTYDPESEISLFNKNGKINFNLPFFYPVLTESKKIFILSNGAFDPTIMPLVRYWGFGPDRNLERDSSKLDSIRNLVNFENIQFDKNSMKSNIPNTQLDFSAIAKGYGVDIVSNYLSKNNYTNHFVEIGGEVRCKGKNIEKDANWKIGVTDPRSERESIKLFAAVNLTDKSIATSGNYYNYRIEDGVRYSHTIDPSTGLPAKRNILSASVILNSCMSADGLATAFMVMGHEKAIEICEKVDSINAYILYSDDNGHIKSYTTKGLQNLITPIE